MLIEKLGAYALIAAGKAYGVLAFVGAGIALRPAETTPPDALPAAAKTPVAQAEPLFADLDIDDEGPRTPADAITLAQRIEDFHMMAGATLAETEDEIERLLVELGNIELISERR